MAGFTVVCRGELVATNYVKTPHEAIEDIARMVTTYGTDLLIYVGTADGLDTYSLADLFDIVRIDPYKPTLVLYPDGRSTLHLTGANDD